MKPRRDKPKTASNSPTFALYAPTSVRECFPYLPTFQLIKLLEVSWFSVGGFLFLVEGFLFSVEGFWGKSKPEKNGNEHGFLLVERRLSKLEKS